MLIVYMSVWSIVMIGALSVGRLSDWRERTAVAVIAFLILFVSQSLFLQLNSFIGATVSDIFNAPERYFQAGPIGWLALLVMPCGWLGPLIGFNVVMRWQATAVDEW